MNQCSKSQSVLVCSNFVVCFVLFLQLLQQHVWKCPIQIVMMFLVTATVHTLTDRKPISVYRAASTTPNKRDYLDRDLNRDSDSTFFRVWTQLTRLLVGFESRSGLHKE